MNEEELNLWAAVLLGVAIGMMLLYVTIKAAILSAYDNIKRREDEG